MTAIVASAAAEETTGANGEGRAAFKEPHGAGARRNDAQPSKGEGTGNGKGKGNPKEQHSPTTGGYRR